MKEKGYFAVSADLAIDAQTYLLERDSTAFRSLLTNTLKIGAMEFTDTSVTEDGAQVVRLVTSPDFGAWVPKALQSQASFQKLEFHDIIEYAPGRLATAPYILSVKTESPMLGHKLDISLRLRVEPTGPQACRQTLEGRIHVGIFGLGRIVEGIVKDQLAATYRRLPGIIVAWNAFRKECIQAGEAWKLLAGRPAVGLEVPWIQQALEAAGAQPACTWVERAGSSPSLTPTCQGAKIEGGEDAAVDATPAPTEYLDAREEATDILSGDSLSLDGRGQSTPRASGMPQGASSHAYGLGWLRTWVPCSRTFSVARSTATAATSRLNLGQGSTSEQYHELHQYWDSVTSPKRDGSGLSHVTRSMGNMVVESFNTVSVSLLLGLTGAGLLKVTPEDADLGVVGAVWPHHAHKDSGFSAPTPREPRPAFSKAGELLESFLERASGESLDAAGLLQGRRTHVPADQPGRSMLGKGAGAVEEPKSAPSARRRSSHQHWLCCAAAGATSA